MSTDCATIDGVWLYIWMKWNPRPRRYKPGLPSHCATHFTIAAVRTASPLSSAVFIRFWMVTHALPLFPLSNQLTYLTAFPELNCHTHDPSELQIQLNLNKCHYIHYLNCFSVYRFSTESREIMASNCSSIDALADPQKTPTFCYGLRAAA
jgi:hypothetical protein